MTQHGRVRAFTLLELLIVVGILALLAALVVPSFYGAGQQARIDAVKATIGQTGLLGTALEMYRQAMGSYPEDDGLMDLWEEPSDVDEIENKWRGPYIQNPEALLDPWGNKYEYAFPGQKNDEEMYDLWSYGPDKEDGTDDDIVNWLRDDDPRARLVNR